MLSFYLPGSFVIVLAVIVSDKSIYSLTLLGASSWVGFTIANVCNYYLGRFGYFRVLLFLGKNKLIEDMKKWLDKNASKTLFFCNTS